MVVGAEAVVRCRIVDGRLQPYHTRAEIDAGVLAGQELEALWAADPIDAFFLQVQGSGRVNLAEGGSIRALAEHFGGQWLQFRALESLTRDRQRFPDFEDYLRLSMRRETSPRLPTLRSTTSRSMPSKA